MEDDEGWGIVGMAIQASCGLSEKEEAVRLVVARWGVDAGPRDGRDNAGWTPLHLAALLSSPQTVSVLLNRGASPLTPNSGGFTPYDLVIDMEGREALVVLLDPLADVGTVDDRLEPERRALLQRRRLALAKRSDRSARKSERIRVAAEREKWVRERAKVIGVDAGVLFAEQEDGGDEDEEETDQDDEDEMEIDEALGGEVKVCQFVIVL